MCGDERCKQTWTSTFVTAVDLLREAADALENNPHDKEPEEMHPQDAWAEASAALDVVTGLAITLTNESRRCPGASPAK